MLVSNYGPPPGQQPGYGQQPSYGPPPGWVPMPPRREQQRTSPVLIAVVAILVVMALGAGVLLYVERDKDPAPLADGSGTGRTGPGRTGAAKLKGQIAWQKAPAPQQSAGRYDDRTTGAWFPPGKVVRMGLGALVAYGAADGKDLWRLTPPRIGGRQSEFCGMSRSVTKGVGAVAFGLPRPGRTSAMCTSVGLVDLNTGRFRWTKQDEDGRPTLGKGQVDFAGNVVVFNRADYITGYNLAGTKVWRRGDDLGTGCGVNDFVATARRLTAYMKCYADSYVGYLNPVSGKQLVRRELKLRERLGGGTFVVNAEPAVILEPGRGSATDRYLIFDDAARTRLTLDQKGPYGTLQTNQQSEIFVPRPRGGTNNYAGVLPLIQFGNGLIVTATEQTAVNGQRGTNKIVAFDANTGKVRWSVPLGPESVGASVAMTDDAVIAVRNGSYENPPVIYSLSLQDGKPTALSDPYPRNEINGLSGFQLSWTGKEMLAVDVTANPFIKAPSVMALR